MPKPGMQSIDDQGFSMSVHQSFQRDIHPIGHGISADPMQPKVIVDCCSVSGIPADELSQRLDQFAALVLDLLSAHPRGSRSAGRFAMAQEHGAGGYSLNLELFSTTDERLHWRGTFLRNGQRLEATGTVQE